MYQSLYRKYRPNDFGDVYGQKVIVKILENQLERDCIGHAYIFSGPRGVGKTSVAKILAKMINCTGEKKPCDKCISCTQINNKDSLDIIEIDAASNNGVDEIRELKSKIALVPTNSKYKVYIVDEVHMLTISAFNALLKTLEEPPAHAMFILATTDPHKIPETITSRCQRLDFKRIADSEIALCLQKIASNEEINITIEAINEIARLSNGGLRDSIGLLELCSSFEKGKIEADTVHEVNGTISKKEMTQLLDLIIEANLEEILNKIDGFYNSGANLTKILEEFVIFLKDVIISKYINNEEQVILERTTEKYLLDLINEINIRIKEIRRYNNPKVVIELLFINLVAKSKVTNVEVKDKPEIRKMNNEINNIEPEVKINTFDNLKKPNIEVLKETENVEPETSNIKDKEEVKKEEIIIKKEIPNINKEEALDILKRKRVDNAFAGVSKKLKMEFQNKIEDIDLFSLDEAEQSIFHYLIDGEVKVCSDKNLIIVFETQTLSTKLNKDLMNIEKLIYKLIGSEYSIIGIDINEWNSYRKEFKSKERNYTYSDDKVELREFFKSQEKGKNSVESLFSELIEK